MHGNVILLQRGREPARREEREVDRWKERDEIKENVKLKKLYSKKTLKKMINERL